MKLQLSRQTKLALTTALLLLLILAVVLHRYDRHCGYLDADYGDSKSKLRNSFASRSYYRPRPMPMMHKASNFLDTASLTSTQPRSTMRSPMRSPIRSPQDPGVNTLVVYAGRWKFIRILFPYIYRELRKNGGVLDRVWFMMLNYDNETYNNLVQLTQIANRNLKQPEDVFYLRFMEYPPGQLPPPKIKYTAPYYEIFAEMMQNSSNRYFKIDDDIVYIHPATFKNIIESKNSQQ